jgi:uncharacterized protein YutE (UPF0331/DUF86 family)
MPNESLVEKLDALHAYLAELRELQPANFDAYEQDKMLRRYAERMLQMTIEQATHIGIGILMDLGARAPDNYHDIFIALGEHGILTPVLVNSMTMMVELRNLLVYEYDVIDHMMVYSVLKRRLDDLAEFGRAVRAYVEQKPYIPSPQFETEIEE